MSLSSEQQLKVLAVIWDKEEPGWVFLPWIPKGGNNAEHRKKNWRESRAFHWPKDRTAILAHLEEREGDDLYFTPNTFLTQARVAQQTGEETSLYADLDEVNPEHDIDRSMRPTVAWESSPGRYQAVWLLTTGYIGASERGGLNHRLTDHIGADPSGWDSTQLLRVPGRPNYKPDYRVGGEPAPGKLLWILKDKDGGVKKYTPEFFEQTLPASAISDYAQDIEDSEIDGIDRHEVWGRVRLKCSHTVRQFMSMKSREIESSEHDRSEVLWQIERDLADAGCTIAEIVAIVRHTGWNKYAGRNNELPQLKSEAIKAKGVSIQDAGEDTLETDAFDGTRPDGPMWASDVLAQPIKRPSWLVRNVWTQGSCGFISGQPKSYKSYFALDMAVSVSLGLPFLGTSQFSTRQGRVLYLQEEDSLPIIVERLAQIVEERAPDRFWHGQLTIEGESPGGVTLDAQGRSWTCEWTPGAPLDALALHVRTGFVASDPAWQSWLAEFVVEHDFALVIIDTLGTTVGDVDTDKANALNDRVLKPLKIISDQAGCAIAIVHHNRKASADSTRSGQQMLGSVALHAWVESALYVQSKEKLTGQDAVVKIERESKMAEDFKFRVKIPTMWQEKGPGETGERQLWDPTVLIGWAEDTEKEQAAAREVATKPRRGNAGRTLAEDALAENWVGRWMTIDQIQVATGKSPATIRRILTDNDGKALKDGWWKQNEQGLYMPMDRSHA